MNRKLFVVTIFVLWGGVGMPPAVWAQPADGPEEGFFAEGPQTEDPGDQGRFAQRRKQHFEEMVKELKLTDDQRKQIESHRQEHMQEIKTLMEQIFQLRKAIGEQLQQSRVDLDKVKQLHGQLKELIFKREDLMFSGILQIREVLTAEQFTLFNQKMGQMRKIFRDRARMRRSSPVEDSE